MSNLYDQIQKIRAKRKGVESDLLYVTADKYLEELEGYMSQSYDCKLKFRTDYKKTLKRRLWYGPDAIVLINTMTREWIG